MSISRAPSRTFSLGDIASAIWTRRWRVVAVAAVVVAVGAAYVFTIGTRYRGEAFLRIAMVTLPDYKKYSTALGDADRFVSWVQARGQFSAGDFEQIARRVRRGENPMTWMSPRFALTKSDVRDLAEIPKDTGAFLGIDITTDAPEPDLAVKLASAVASYLRDVFIEGRVRDLTLLRLSELETQAGKLTSSIASGTNDLDVLEKKRENLAKLRPRFADVGRLDTRQIVSLEFNGERFLPIDVQMLGVESEIVNTREQLERDQRKLEKVEFMLDYYNRARATMTPDRTAQEIVAGLEQARGAALKTRDINKSWIREGAAEIDADVRHVQLLVNQAVRLDTEPRRALAWERYRQQILLAAFAAIGILLGVLYAIASEWRRRNRPSFVAGSGQ